MLAMQATPATPPAGIHGKGDSQPMSAPAALARTGFPVAAASGAIALGTVALKLTRPAQALKVARFTNLALASLIAGNGVGSVLFVQPALGSLAEGEYFRSEQALARHYADIMRALRPATVVSCVAVLGLIPDRQSAAFRLTLGGTAGFLGMLATTAPEVPINKQTLVAPPDSPPADWLDRRVEWNRFNQLRTLFETGGWICFCLASLADTRAKR
jgi:hypothetical protein